MRSRPGLAWSDVPRTPFPTLRLVPTLSFLSLLPLPLEIPVTTFSEIHHVFSPPF